MAIGRPERRETVGSTLTKRAQLRLVEAVGNTLTKRVQLRLVEAVDNTFTKWVQLRLVGSDEFIELLRQ